MGLQRYDFFAHLEKKSYLCTLIGKDYRMKHIYQLLFVMALAIVCASCDKNNDPTPSSRDAMIGTYSVTIQGNVDLQANLPLIGQKAFTYPLELKDRTMTITPDSLHEDSVEIQVDSLIVLTKGEVISNKLLINPTKIECSLGELIETLDLGQFASIVTPIFGDITLDIHVYHSTATLKDNTITLTSDIDASISAGTSSLSVKGTLNDTAVKQTAQQPQ